MNAGDLEGAWLHADYQEQLGPGQWPDHSMDATSPVYKTPVFISNLRDIKLMAISKELATQSLSILSHSVKSSLRYDAPLEANHFFSFQSAQCHNSCSEVRQLSYMTDCTHVLVLIGHIQKRAG